MYNGRTYVFNTGKIRDLAKKYPFDYRFEKIRFQTREEYIKYLDKQKEDKLFLFSYSPMFKYDGSFEMQFPRNQQYTSPKAISEYLTPIIEKIVSKDDYHVYYKLNEKNRKDQSQFTMTIEGKKKVFDSLQINNLKKGEWTPTVEEGWFFYKKAD